MWLFYVSCLFLTLYELCSADCASERKSLKQNTATNGHPIVGAFIPTCEPDGSYKAVQCHPSTGYCWCVNTTSGQKIEGTDKRPGAPQCATVGVATTVAPGTTQTPTNCASETKSLTQNSAEDEPPIVGAFIPTCESDGSYKAVQCHPSTGYCWCVNTTSGQKIEGTDKRFGTPQCSTVEAATTVAPGTTQTPTKCRTERDSLILSGAAPGKFIPVCDTKGRYMSRQCDFSTNGCWCVDKKTGEKINGSDMSGADHSINCKKFKPSKDHGDDTGSATVPGDPTTCKEQQDQKLANPIPDQWVFDCDEDGNYQQLQCYGFTHRCYCVDKITGERVPGTDGTVDNKPDCSSTEKTSSGKLTCAEYRKQKLVKPLPDEWIFECDDDGNYKRLQCYDFTHTCSCVDSITGELIPGKNGTLDKKPDCSDLGTADENNFSAQTNQRSVLVNLQPQADFASGLDLEIEPGTPDLSSCVANRAKALSGQKQQGLLVPNCTASGDYEKLQCHPVSKHCWCVDPKTGKTSSSRGAGLSSIGVANCNEMEQKSTFAPRVIPPSDCPYKQKEAQQKLNATESSSSGKNSSKIFVPECTEEGYYKTLQCSFGSCYCVHNVSGQKYPGTETKLSINTQTDCANAEAIADASFNTTCAKQRFHKINSLPFPIVGVMIPQCENDGNFAALQCHGSTGYCWCVDRKTGEKIAGTEKPPGRGQFLSDCSSISGAN